MVNEQLTSGETALKDSAQIITVDPAIDLEFYVEAVPVGALVLIANAQGVLPKSTHKNIRKITAQGRPVFVLSDNPKEDYGVLGEHLYEEDKTCGATFLSKVNVNGAQEVAMRVQDLLREGLGAEEIFAKITTEFCYGPEETIRTSHIGTENFLNEFQVRVKSEAEEH